MAPSDPAIELDRVSRTFDAGKSRAVNKVSFHVLPGEVVALLGGSGCGKTTTLKMINRLIEPSGGHIFIDGVDNRSLEAIQLRREIGYVFQGIGLFPHMTIYQNIAVVPRMLRWRPADVQLRVEQLMSMVGLDPEKYGGQMPHQLSGGQ